MSIETVATTSITSAGDDDIEAAAHVYQAAAEELGDRLRAYNPWTSLAARSEDFEQAVGALRTLQRRDDQSVVIARQNGAIVGMGAVSIEMPHAHIAFFFVKPDHQNRGIGRSLMDQLLLRIDRAGATQITLASSRDPKAWRRYMQAGLAPGPPQLPFRAKEPCFPAAMPSHPDYELLPIGQASVGVLCELDRVVRGADRPDRVAAWLEAGSTGSAIVHRHTGQPVGYALVSMMPHWAEIGPVVALEPEQFPFALHVGLAHAGRQENPRKLPWRVDFSARNRLAIAPLLKAGFSAENLVNWFESGPVGLWDRYIFRNEDEL